MAQKKSRSSVRSSVKAREFEPLTEEEMLFCWKSLVDEGKLSIPKLQTFMQQVCGVNLSTVQARDMIQYMDANGDGRVGLEDFKNFMSIGRLADTDAKNFMWTPKAQFRMEHGIGKNAKEDDAGLLSAFSSHSDEKRRGSAVFSDAGLILESSAVPAKPTTPPDAKAPGKRRPAPGRGQADSIKNVEKEDEKKDKKVASERTNQLIETAISNYERQSWERFLKEEADFKRYLFDQFSGGKDELDVMDYHRMLLKWFPLAEWCAPRGIRPADSLAALEYIVRRDREDRGLAAPAEKKAEEGDGAAAAAGSGGAGASSSEAPGEEPVPVQLPYSMWLDVLHGKHRPEEHHTTSSKEVKEAHTPWSP